MCDLMPYILFSCSYCCPIHTVPTLLYISLQTHILPYSCLYRTHFVYIVYELDKFNGALLYADLSWCQPFHRGEGGLVRRKENWVDVHMSNSILCQYSMYIRCTCRSHVLNWSMVMCHPAQAPAFPEKENKSFGTFIGLVRCWGRWMHIISILDVYAVFGTNPLGRWVAGCPCQSIGWKL